MTREEAINMLHGIRADNLNLGDAYTKDKYKALGMAIISLEQLPKLQKRCYALTKGTMCGFCKYECQYKAEAGE